MKGNLNQRVGLVLSCLLFLISASCNIGFSQIGNTPNLPTCAFESANTIQFADSMVLTQWVDNLKKAQETGGIQILHIGDSHVQSGAMTAATRLKLQKIYGDKGFGLMFPYAAAKTYSPRGYKSRYVGEFQFSKSFQPYPQFAMGLGGATIQTKQVKSAVRILQLPMQPLKTQYELTLWVPNSDSLFEAVVKVAGSEFGFEKIADSTQSSVLQLRCVFPALDSFQIALKKQSVQQKYWMLYGMNLQVLNRSGLLYHGAGMGGARVESVLNSSVAFSQIQDLSPQIIIVDLGTNDFAPLAKYPDKIAVQLAILIGKIKRAAPNALVVLATPMDMQFHGKKVPHTFTYSEQMALLAKELGCGLWDWYWIAGANKAVTEWQQKKWLSGDGIHMTEPGYWVKGGLLADALFELIQKGVNADSIIAKNQLNYDSLWLLKYPNQKPKVKTVVASPISKPAVVSSSNKPATTKPTITKPATSPAPAVTPLAKPKVAVNKPVSKVPVAVSPVSPQNKTGNAPVVVKILRNTVKPGEIIEDVAFEYDVSIAEIKKWNKLSGNKIVPGKTLIIRKAIPVGTRSR